MRDIRRIRSVDQDIGVEIAADMEVISRRESRNSAPLSFAQQRLWFLDRLDPQSTAYHMPAAIRLTGTLSTEALYQTLREIGRRHETLRTTFGIEAGKPAQFVSQHNPVSLPFVDLSLLQSAEKDDAAKVLTEAEISRLFDLTVGPLFRSVLLQLSRDHHVLICTTHHIVSDGWSQGVLVYEMSSLYNAFAEGTQSPFPELPVQYADFSVWQRKWLQGHVLEEQLSYWRDQLDGAPEVIEIPSDRPRPSVQTFRGGSLRLEIVGQERQILASLCSSAGATLFMGLLAAFQTLLFRYTGNPDLVVGSPIANRTLSEIEGLIGFFVNTLAYRGDLSGNPTFRQLLLRVRQSALAAFAHQDLPFERIVEELRPERNVSYNPLFQVIFALQNAPLGDLNLGQVVLSSQPFDVSSTRFDLECHLWEQPDRFTGFLSFSADLFDTTTISRIISHFKTLIRAVTQNPYIPIEQLDFLEEAERWQVLAEWNATEVRYPFHSFVHNMVETAAAETPDSLALSDRNNQLSYRDLNQRANRIADYLRQLGTNVDSIVGVLMDRSVEWVTVLLGILKAGSGYACFDPSYPRDRIAYMVEDCGARIIFADRKRLPLIQDNPVTITDPQTLMRETSSYGTDDHSNSAQNAGVSYVVYTSGSTGKPKGVITSHASLVNLVMWHKESFNVTAVDRASQVARCGFDVATWEIWPYLASGACVVLPDEETRMSPLALRQWLIDQQITIAWLPPVLSEAMLLDEAIKELKLRIMFSGGDRLVLRPPVASTFEYVNAFGPSEATVFVSAGTVSADEGASAPHIGRPLPNTRIFLLDRRLQPAPAGVHAELCIAGANLARGYLFRPDLTAEKFVPDPFSQLGERIYRTGDLARFRPDGNIEFLGRIDNQIKLRGFRIELGEIESALLENPLVREAAVAALDDPAGKRLAAYVVIAPAGRDSDSGRLGLLEQDHVSGWRNLFDQTYAQSSATDGKLNVIGWNSSYTKAPIPIDQMIEWKDSTVKEILSRKPKRILEIGCGTGLLLLEIAPHAEEYWGTDFSDVSLDYVRKQLNQPPLQTANVNLLRKLADDFEGIPAGYFDAIVLNSLVQYFPGFEYLLRVLRGALRAAKPTGFVFVGDVRNLDLLEPFHASILLQTAADSLTATELRSQITTSTNSEEELLVSPRFFAMLTSLIPEAGSTEINLKRSRHHNELTRYRYNVVLGAGNELGRVYNPARLDWQRDSLTPQRLREILTSYAYECLLIKDIPNSRVIGEIETLRLARSGITATISDLKVHAAELASAAFDPENICAIGEEFSYHARLYLPGSFDNAFFDVVFLEPGADPKAIAAIAATKRTPSEGEMRGYLNSPLQDKIAARLVPELRLFLSNRLPEYMVPSAFVLLESLPRNANGKIDRKNLPNAVIKRSDNGQGFVAPLTQEEELIAGIWSQVLGVDRIGAQ
ncbi:MAG TPA: amino acid adenylation domain-containing protein, partial [Blastocatellia bacterium]|nr:amino acid adenylation domain-containing protein [Blastocatellia bacterium]